jgi:hypothetical protein
MSVFFFLLNEAGVDGVLEQVSLGSITLKNISIGNILVLVNLGTEESV